MLCALYARDQEAFVVSMRARGTQGGQVKLEHTGVHIDAARLSTTLSN